MGLYTKLVSKMVPIDSEDLKYDLTQDPVLTKSLETLVCDMYYRFGTLLCPLIILMLLKRMNNQENNQEKKNVQSVVEKKNAVEKKNVTLQRTLQKQARDEARKKLVEWNRQQRKRPYGS